MLCVSGSTKGNPLLAAIRPFAGDWVAHSEHDKNGALLGCVEVAGSIKDQQEQRG